MSGIPLPVAIIVISSIIGESGIRARTFAKPASVSLSLQISLWLINLIIIATTFLISIRIIISLGGRSSAAIIRAAAINWSI